MGLLLLVLVLEEKAFSRLLSRVLSGAFSHRLFLGCDGFVPVLVQ